MNPVKEKIVNLQENVTNQSQTESIVEFVSAFDLSHKYEKSVGAEYVKKLYSLYGEEYTYLVENSRNHDEIDYD